MQQPTFGPVARLLGQVRLGRQAAGDAQAQLDVFDALTGDVADLKRHQGLADLGLDVAGDGRDRTGDVGDLGMLFLNGAGVDRQPVRHGGDQGGVFAAQGLFELQGLLQAGRQIRQLIGQFVQLADAQVQLAAHALGEAGELVRRADGGPGRNLDVQRKGPEVAQRCAHRLDIGLKLGAGDLDVGEIGDPVLLGLRQGVQSLGRGQQVLGRVRHGFGVQGDLKPIQGFDQSSHHFQRPRQPAPGVGETAFDQRTRCFELVDDGCRLDGETGRDGEVMMLDVH